MKEMNRIAYYEKIMCLGVGGLSDVWLVNDIRDNHTYAMKHLHTKHHHAGKDSLLQEIEILKTLQHPRIPKLIDSFHIEDNIYEIMEYIPGTSIPDSYTCEEEGIIKIALQILDILQYLHQHDILYCDLKPDNLIMKNGQLYLVDFGAAIQKHRSATMRYGTIGFAAPEQYVYGEINQQVDIYAFGKTILALILPQTTPSSLTMHMLMKQSISVYLKYIVLRCIQEETRKRYNTVTFIQKEFLNVYAHPHWHKKLWFRFLIFIKYYYLIVFDVHWGAIKNRMFIKWDRKKVWKETSLSKTL